MGAHVLQGGLPAEEGQSRHVSGQQGQVGLQEREHEGTQGEMSNFLQQGVELGDRQNSSLKQ